MTTIGLLTVTDGRPSVQSDVGAFVAESEQRLASALTARGFAVVRAAEIVGSNAIAVREARRVAASQPDLTVINIPVWAFPHFTMLAAGQTDSPLALFSTLDPKYPGMVGMLAAGGALDQIGRVHVRAWGDSSTDGVVDGLGDIARAAAAAAGLRGSTFGRIGGRPMGMYTAVSNPDQWMRQFGIDVEEIDQYELVRRAETIDPAIARAGREWLELHVAAVHYDGARLTPELLERQVRVYEAMRELIDEWNLDFCGIKAQPELTDHYCTTDIAEAFLNDPYDWHGAKRPIVCSTEADMDAALTMQLLHGLTGTPVLFADVRHYHADRGIWDLCNSGQHATWFAERSAEPAENLRHVHLYPEDFYFPAAGAAVHYLAGEGEMTFARLTRLDGRYRMQVMRGAFERYDDETNTALMKASTFVWPHAFARLEAPADEILQRFGSNHIHAVPGDHVVALRRVCDFLDIAFDGFGGA